MKRLLYVFGCALVLLALVGCQGAQSQDQAPPTTPTEQGGQDTGSATSDNVQVVEVEAYQYGWSPNPIRVKKGQPVRLKLRSRDVAHGIGIPAFGVSKQIPGNGETVTVEFTPDKAGTFNFACTVYCGRGHSSMTGKLIVEA